MKYFSLSFALAGGAMLLFSGCASLEQQAARRMSASMAEAAAKSFAQESDVELAGQAMPFALKTLDMLALKNPRDPAIQLAAARAYISYSNIFLDWEARIAEESDLAKAEALRQRAAALYQRGRDYAAQALGKSTADLREAWREQPDEFLQHTTKKDVAALFWLGAGWAGSTAVHPSDLESVADIPVIESVLRRALELDPTHENGAIHEFFVLYEGSRGTAAGGSLERAEYHFDQAVKISRGRLASPYLALATSVAIQRQDASQFQSLLEKALAVDIQADPDLRFANSVAQSKARWYLEHRDYFILSDESESP